MQKNIAMITALLFLLIAGTVSATPADVRGHWAQPYILPLLEQGIMSPQADGTFQPDEPLQRGHMRPLALLKKLTPANTEGIPDLDDTPRHGHLAALVEEGIIALYPDGTYRPHASMTRGEMAIILANLLDIQERERRLNPRELAAPHDMEADHWAMDDAKIISHLGLLPLYPDGTFRPNQEITRGELAHALYRLQKITTLSGFLHEAYPTSRTLALEGLDGNRRLIDLDKDVLMGRNQRLIQAEDLRRRDRLFILLDDHDRAIYVQSYGVMTQEDLTTEISRLSQNLLSPEDVAILLQGQYQDISPQLAEEAKEQLLTQGFEEKEIDALLDQDWSAIEDLGKIRLGELISMETGLPLDMTRAFLDQDWSVLQDLTRLELLQQVLQGIISLNIIQY